MRRNKQGRGSRKCVDVWYDGMCHLRQELRKALWRWHSSQHLNKTRHRLGERLGKRPRDRLVHTRSVLEEQGRRLRVGASRLREREG